MKKEVPQKKEPFHLVLLMTAGNTVLNWWEIGSYIREIKLYKDLSVHDIKITILDYSSSHCWVHAPYELKRELLEFCIDIVPLYGDYQGKNRYVKLYKSFCTTFSVHRNYTHLKSNQSKGAWLGFILKLLNSKSKFLHRSGYSWSNFTLRISNNKLKYASTRLIEFIINVSASCIHVASETDLKKLTIMERHKAVLVPNWVEVPLDRPVTLKNKSIWVGRMEPQKNIIELLKTWPQNEDLILIGNGSLSKTVSEVVKQRSLKTQIIEKLEHQELMQLIRSCKCLVMYSNFEGNPKVLLEALFVGVPVIAKRAEGVSEIMEKGSFGIILDDHKLLEKSLLDISSFKLDLKLVQKILKTSQYAYTLEQNIRFIREDFT